MKAYRARKPTRVNRIVYRVMRRIEKVLLRKASEGHFEHDLHFGRQLIGHKNEALLAEVKRLVVKRMRERGVVVSEATGGFITFKWGLPCSSTS